MVNKYLIFSLLLSFGILALASCDENKEAFEEKAKKVERDKMKKEGVIYGSSQSTYTGKPGQLVVVAENTVFTDELAEILDTTFGALLSPYHYPPHKKFEIVVLEPERFKEAHLRLRNVLKLKFSDDVSQGQPELLIKKDYHARKQLMVELTAENYQDLRDKLLMEAAPLTKLYEELEWKREFARLKKDNNTVIKSRLKKDFGITLELPKDARYEVNKKGNFAKIMFPDRSKQMDLKAGGGDHGAKANFIHSGLMIWEIPYTKESQFQPAYLLKARDTMLKYNAHHEIPGVYMGTQYHPAILPIHTYMQVGSVQGYEFRGFFKFTGRMQPSGGKFWSFHFIHPKRNTIMAVSGYVDAPPTVNPAFDLRRIQACIYSLEIAD